MPTDDHRRLRDTWYSEPEADPGRSARFHHAEISGDHDRLPQRDRNWLTRHREAETFWIHHNRPPREKSPDPAEASTANWLRRQRTNLDRLCLYQIDLLNTLPYEWDPRGEHQAERHENYEAFVAHHGRPPRRRSTDPDERSLARWTTKR